MAVIIKTVRHWEDTPLPITGRVVGENQAALVQADIDSIAVNVFDSTGTQISSTLVPVVADSIFDTLQSWDEDSTGYNFRYTIPAAYFPTGSVLERIEVIITPADGEAFPGGVWEVHVENLQSS